LNEHTELNPNLEQLRQAILELGELAPDLVFDGGCATGFVVTDPAAVPISQTIDVNAIVELSSLLEFHKLFKRIRKRGFSEHRSADAPILSMEKGRITAKPKSIHGHQHFSLSGTLMAASSWISIMVSQCKLLF